MVSVIMPAYNAEKFVGEAIESILNQTFKDFEFIIIDDGSTDATLSIIKKYAKQDKRIRILTQRNQGMAMSLNRGIQEARFNWIARMDADDVAFPKRLETQLKMVKKTPEVIAWGTYAYHINEKGKILSLSTSGPKNLEEFKAIRSKGDLIHLIHPTVLMRREMVLKAGLYDPRFEEFSDVEFFNRLSDFGPLLVIPQPLLSYRIHSSNSSFQKFFKMRLVTRYVRIHRRAITEGIIPPTWEEFIQGYWNVPLTTRIHRTLDDMSQFYYRKFAIAVSSERYMQAIAFFAVSALLNPKYVSSKVWRQRFSREARGALSRISIREGTNKNLFINDGVRIQH